MRVTKPARLHFIEREILVNCGHCRAATGHHAGFHGLARLRWLRGTAFDIFGYSADRRLERDLIAGYEKDVAHVLTVLSPLNLDTAIEILSLPDRIRGYGPVKEKSVQDAKARYAQLAGDLANPPPVPRQIAAE